MKMRLHSACFKGSTEQSNMGFLIIFLVYINILCFIRDTLAYYVVECFQHLRQAH